MRALGVRCDVVACDLTEEGASDRLFEWVGRQTKRLDFYVHNAAATAFKPLLGLKSHNIDKTFNLTLKSYVLNVQHAVDFMKDGGAIVAVSGMDTLKAVPFHGLLGAAKSALETLTAYFAEELAHLGIRANAVNPGFFASESTRKYMGEGYAEAEKVFSLATPFGRLPRLEEVAGVIVFLLSSESSWVAGQTIRVDGGQNFHQPMPRLRDE